MNIDLSNKCSLACPRCARSGYKVKDIPGRDLSLDEVRKILEYIDTPNVDSCINFCGQFSDPTHHPKFIEILKMTREYEDIVTTVHIAASGKPMAWFIKAFKANPNAKWRFGIDGLPEDSDLYRINQDGVKLFKVMLEAKKHLVKRPEWQYIIFRYNENDIEECQQIADDHGLRFIKLKTNRWRSHDDPLMPRNPKNVP